jgi:porin
MMPRGVGYRRSRTYDVYATIQQKLWEEPGAPHQGLSGFLAVTYGPPDLNTIEHFVDGGLPYTGLVPGPDRDVLGLYGHFSLDLSRSQVLHHEPGMAHEAILELNYQYNITSWLYVQPDIQGVLRPERYRTRPGCARAGRTARRHLMNYKERT